MRVRLQELPAAGQQPRHRRRVATKSLREFAGSPEEATRVEKYGEEAEDLMTALHEVIGHGSGKLSERLKGGAEPYLKEYFSTLEEARADLMALWNVWDPELKKLGLVSDQESVARAMYDNAARVSLTQLRRITRGDTIEEDHAARSRADRQLHQGQDRRHRADHARRQDASFRVKDYQKMREGAGHAARAS